jgi:hypothetical protein
MAVGTLLTEQPSYMNCHGGSYSVKQNSNSRDLLMTTFHTQVSFPATYRTQNEPTEPCRLQVMLAYAARGATSAFPQVHKKLHPRAWLDNKNFLHCHSTRASYRTHTTSPRVRVRARLAFHCHLVPKLSMSPVLLVL